MKRATFRLGLRSYAQLVGVNPVLSSIVVEAISLSKYDWSVFEGVRTVARQKYLVSKGRSWTMRSKHLTGNAVDLVPYINGRLTWDGEEASKVFEDAYNVMNEVAKKRGVVLRCGADWKSVDKPHFELTSKYNNKYNYLRIIKYGK